MEKDNERTLLAVVFNPSKEEIYYTEAFNELLITELDCLVELFKAGKEASTHNGIELEGIYGIVYDVDNDIILLAYTGTNENGKFITLNRNEFPSIPKRAILRDMLLRKLKSICKEVVEYDSDDE
jgi:hypothetical protein